MCYGHVSMITIKSITLRFMEFYLLLDYVKIRFKKGGKKGLAQERTKTFKRKGI